MSFHQTCSLIRGFFSSLGGGVGVITFDTLFSGRMLEVKSVPMALAPKLEAEGR